MNGSPSTAKIVLLVIAVAFGVFGGFLGFSGIRFLFYATQQDHPILITRILYGSLGPGESRSGRAAVFAGAPWAISPPSTATGCSGPGALGGTTYFVMSIPPATEATMNSAPAHNR